MKPIRTILFLYGMIILSAFSCEKEKQNVQIIKELPPFFISCNLHEGETSVIKDRQTFGETLDTVRLNQIVELQGIDFSKYDLLIGAASFTRGISKLEYSFSRIKANSFIFNVTIFYDLTLPAGTFFCGILVEKLPVDSEIKFETSSKFE